jgi:D-alanine transfer protein
MGCAKQDNRERRSADVMNPKSGHPFLRALLPVGLAFVLVCGAMAYASFFSGISESYKRNAAISLSANILLGNFIKNQTLSDSRYVPFFGSSELRRFDSFHPSVLAEKYGRNYRPFMLGAAGTQCLVHYSMLSSMENEMRGRKAVFVLSPQWFSREGINANHFGEFYSPLQIYQWIAAIDTPDEYEAYYARRLLTFDVIKNNRLMHTALKGIANGEKPDLYVKIACDLEYRLLSIEDHVFGRAYLPARNIEKLAETLPETYDAEALDKLAWEEGRENTSNNELLIRNSFYNSRLRAHIKNKKGSQAGLDYTKSPEFGDFELVLHKMKTLDMNALFIIPPINGRWINYTGLPRDMLEAWNRKIVTQLENQGFTNILNLQGYTDTPYFMQDTIHLGWRSWVAADKVIAPFLEGKGGSAPRKYRTDTYYLSKEWANHVPGINTESR